MEQGESAPRPVARRRSASRFCAFGLDDETLRDVALGSLSPILVCFVADDDPRWDILATLAETIASAGLRCLLADPARCRTAASLLDHRAPAELLLVVHGRTVRRIDPSTAVQVVDVVADVVADAVATLDHPGAARHHRPTPSLVPPLLPMLPG